MDDRFAEPSRYSWTSRAGGGLRDKAVPRTTLVALAVAAVGMSSSVAAAGRGGLAASVAAAGAGGAVAQERLIAFDHYHTLDEFDAYVTVVAERYAELVTVVQIGRSRGGRPIVAVEINNPQTGTAADKPGFYLDGNIHGGELLGGEGALHFIDRLLSGYSRNPRLTELVDRHAFYVVPVVNPDGRAISVNTPENHRHNIRPVDDDDDGLVDEDPPEDLDGDGRILQMRVPNPRGRFKAAPDDPRRMVQRGRGDTDGPFYDLLQEGVDNDGDGRINEDRVGGIDLNRNFPVNWTPAQENAGPFPLSEPESYALVEYITARPNIAAVHTYHTSGGLILRFPTLADQDWDYPESDLEDYRAIAADGAELTGYRNYAYGKQPIVDLMSPGHGVFNDWASKVFGVTAITTEMWAHAFGEGQEALFRWNDEVLGGRGFVGWRGWEHPDLGPVELGGWDRFSTSNPPEDLIAGELERNTEWVLTFAEKLPRVAIVDARAMEVAGGDGLITVQASVANVGWMPTATAWAIEGLGMAEPVSVEISLDNARLVPDVPGRSNEGATFQRQILGHLRGERPGRPAQVHHLLWNVEILDPSRPTRAVVVARSQKGGVARVELELAAR